MNQGYEFDMNHEEAESFCQTIVACMMQLFHITETEAIGRISRQWKGQHFKTDDIRFHETEEFWANDIYYGAESYWWTHPSHLSP